MAPRTASNTDNKTTRTKTAICLGERAEIDSNTREADAHNRAQGHACSERAQGQRSGAGKAKEDGAKDRTEESRGCMEEESSFDGDSGGKN